MDMLIIRPRTRNDAGAVTSKIAVWRQKSRKFGPATMERALRCRQDLAVYGPHQSGKSRWLNRLHQDARLLWSQRSGAALFRGLEPLATWLEQPEAIAWHGAQPDAKPWDKLRQNERLAVLLAWVQAAKPVVFFDDAHKLTGRKADIAVQLARGAGVVVHAASEEARIALSLRMVLQQRDPQVVRLSSEAAYDYTSVLVWLMCILTAAAGAWPVAGAIAGLKVLGHGSRAAKQA